MWSQKSDHEIYIYIYFKSWDITFLVSDRGIEVDSSKIIAILEMPPPKSEKEIRGFLGRLQYIS